MRDAATAKDGGRSTEDRHRWWPLAAGAWWPLAAGAVLCLIIAINVGLRGKYRVENIDDAWYLSIAWSFLHGGRPDDPVFGGNTGGVQVSGQLFAYLWGAVLDHAGWAKGPAQLVSSITILAGVGCWLAVGLDLLKSWRAACTFVLLLLCNEAVFAAGNQARPDTLTFLFVSIVVLATLRGWWFWAGLCVPLAIETHPVGVISLVLASAVMFSSRSGPLGKRMLRPSDLARGAAGVLAGSAFYLILHARFWHAYDDVLSANMGPGNYLWVYYFELTFRRHLPELAMLIVAIAVSMHDNSWRKHRVVSALLLGSILASVAFPRGNFHYAVLSMPGILLFIVAQAQRRGWLSAVLVVHFMLLAPQYLYVWRTNHGFEMDTYLHGLAEVDPGPGELVVGRPNAWFALVDRPFMVSEYVGDPRREAGQRLLWIEEADPSASMSPQVRQLLLEDYVDETPVMELTGAMWPTRVHHMRRSQR